MCHFILAVLPARVDPRALEDLKLVAFAPLANARVREQLRADDRVYCTTRGHCQCGTFLGSMHVDPSREEAHRRRLDADAEKLRKKGWTAAKVERWRKAKEPSKVAPRGARADMERAAWKALVERGVQGGMTPELGVLLHTFGGDLERERIEIKEEVVVAASAATPEYLAGIAEDALYRIRG